MLSNLFNKSTTANKLMNLKWASTMRALLSLFCKPFSHAFFAAQLTTARTNHSIINFSKTNKAFKKLFDILICCCFLFFSLLSILMSRNIWFNNSSSICTLYCSNFCKSCLRLSICQTSSIYNSSNWITHWNYIIIIINIILLWVWWISKTLIWGHSIQLGHCTTSTNSKCS